jgi:glyoxylase-like metal-dependent hydrolase (beta-lactamase superfamily II)
LSALSLPPGIQVFERGWLSSNNILFIDEERTALVDSGYLTHAEQTVALVRHALGQRPLDALINTHLHSDHCGGNAALQRAYGCHTSIPAAKAQAVADWDEEALTFRATGQQCERFAFDTVLRDGERLRLAGMEWQALAAPGHDPHSLILYCAVEGILISADALWENGFGVIFPELEGASGFAEQAAVLAMVRELAPRLVIPGHGAPFTDVAGALARAQGRLDYFMADPRRNARNAVKVMIAFLLLERGELSLRALQEQIAGNRLMSAAAAQVGQALHELVPVLAGELQRAGAARLDGERLLAI